MTATAALLSARNAGVRVRVDAGDLVLEAPAAPPTTVLDALRRHKAEIVFLLDVGSEAWSSEDWCEFYDERVAMAEFDGGLSPTHAVDLAFCFWVPTDISADRGVRTSLDIGPAIPEAASGEFRASPADGPEATTDGSSGEACSGCFDESETRLLGQSSVQDTYLSVQ